MAGIKANSGTNTMLDGATAVDKAVVGYLRNEQITLDTTGTPASFVWGISKPAGATARSDLNSTTAAAVTFSPDKIGLWLITCNVATATYIIRIDVVDFTQSPTINGQRFSPVLEASVPTPASGAVLFWSEDAGVLKQKLSDGSIKTITVS